MNTERFLNAFGEDKYIDIPKENLIVFGIRSVIRCDEGCSLERLVKECFTLFPKAFGFSRYPEWPDSLKFDRPLRTLRGRNWIVGGAKTMFSLTRFGEAVAEETENILTGKRLVIKPTKRTLRGSDTALVYFLKGSTAFDRFFKDKEGFSITEMELRALLRCTLETPFKILIQNLEYTKKLATDYHDDKLLDFLETCERNIGNRESGNAI